MIYVLDTDTVSNIVRKNSSVIENLIKHEDDEICISAISYAELRYGLEKKESDRLFEEVNAIVGKLSIIDFDESQSEIYGKIRVKLEKSGTPVDDMDLLIAASALSAGAVLVSHNISHIGLFTSDLLETQI